MNDGCDKESSLTRDVLKKIVRSLFYLVWEAMKKRKLENVFFMKVCACLITNTLMWAEYLYDVFI